MPNGTLFCCLRSEELLIHNFQYFGIFFTVILDLETSYQMHVNRDYDILIIFSSRHRPAPIPEEDFKRT